MKKSIIFFYLFYCTISNFSQCTWNEILFDSFEYTTVCSDLIQGMTYQDVPQNYSPHSGNSALYMNIVDGQIGLIYSRTLTNLCPGVEYQLSFWTKDAWDQTIDLDFNILDENNTLVVSQNFSVSGFNWNQGILHFTPTSTTYYFQIVTNLAGTGGNDPVVDDIQLQRCELDVTSLTDQAFCSNDLPYNLINLIEIETTFSNQGSWTGPSALANGSTGEFDPQTNLSGLYTYTVSTNPNCPDSVASLNISVNPIPIFSVNPDLTVCLGDTVSLTATSSNNNLSYSWSNGVINGAGFPATATQSFNVVATDLNNCSSSQTANVEVLPLPIAAAEVEINGSEVNFINLSQNALDYEWDYGNGETFSSSSLEDVSTFYENGGIYNVSLTASNGICSSIWTASININIIVEIQVPNIFTPNGDKLNDLFFIQSKNLMSLSTTITNRWGNEMISFNELDFKWDGKVNNELVSEGVYFILYNGLDKNNNVVFGQQTLSVIY